MVWAMGYGWWNGLHLRRKPCSAVPATGKWSSFLESCSIKLEWLSNVCFSSWEDEKWSKSLRRPECSYCIVSASFISFHAVPHWEGGMSATSRTWSWEINWFPLVLLHSLWILKNTLLGLLKSDRLPFVAEQNCSGCTTASLSQDHAEK